ncbi:hypothetical protein B0H13DRAFT_2373677 [Mycena leptocephala]|nr:hypothetical protein B0H13DRAFT_2373677 [Mycena leptocephala]
MLSLLLLVAAALLTWTHSTAALCVGASTVLKILDKNTVSPYCAAWCIPGSVRIIKPVRRAGEHERHGTSLRATTTASPTATAKCRSSGAATGTLASTAILCTARPPHRAEERMDRKERGKRKRKASDGEPSVRKEGNMRARVWCLKRCVGMSFSVSFVLEAAGRGVVCGDVRGTGRQLKREDTGDADALASHLDAFARPRLGDVVKLEPPLGPF